MSYSYTAFTSSGIVEMSFAVFSSRITSCCCILDTTACMELMSSRTVRVSSLPNRNVLMLNVITLDATTPAAAMRTIFSEMLSFKQVHLHIKPAYYEPYNEPLMAYLTIGG
jgi:hypothetical protein